MLMLRFALRVVLFFLALGIVIGIATPETGPTEKIVLVFMLVGVLAAGIPAGRIGVRHTQWGGLAD
ncbi:MAG: hypothetical protein WD598_03735 [Acidimicrobiia bacterium]